MKKTLFAVLAWFSLAPMLIGQGATKPVVLEDLWYVMRMQGGEVGYLHSRSVQSGDRIETVITTEMKIKRLGSTVEVESRSASVERSDDGKLIEVSMSSKMSNQDSESRATFGDGMAKIVTKLMGREREREIEVDDGVIGPWRLSRMLVGEDLQPGRKAEAVTFAAELDGIVGMDILVVGEEEVTVLGEKVTLVKTESRMEKMPFTTTSWLRRDGTVVRTMVPMAGIKMEQDLATRQQALAAVGKSELSPDVFQATMIVAKRSVPFARTASAATVAVRSKESGRPVQIVESNGQRVVSRGDDGVVTMRLERRVPPTGHAGRRPLALAAANAAGVGGSLAASTMLQSDEPEIRELAQQAVGDERDAWAAAQKIESWVFEHITNKNFGVGMASALEVCRDREGDCSEHAMLLAAMCRAVGIPARVAMGVVYLGGIWGGHAWNEVYVDGQWYPLDATMGYGSADPLRLQMVSMSLQEGSMAEEFMQLMAAFGRLDIEVQEVVHRGRVLDCDAAGAVTNAEHAKRYVNRLWGLSLEAPEGFEIESGPPSAQISFELLEVEGRSDGGEPRQIEVAVMDVPAGFAWPQLRTMFGLKGEFEELLVDDRPARAIERQRSAGNERVTFVLAGDALFVFELGRIASDADRELLATLLASVDFDVATAGK
ncbi:MAG: transglutaminase family protein [Planctomycetota bacterium]